MRDKCILAVKAAALAAGKKLTQADLDAIERNIARELNNEWQTNRDALQAMTPAQRTIHAGEIAAKKLLEQKQRDLRVAADNVLKEHTNRSFIDANGAKVGHVEALRRLLTNWLDGKVGVQSLEQRRKAFVGFYMRNMGPIAEATSKYLGFWADRDTQLDMVRYAFDPKAKVSAKARHVIELWRDKVAEPMRQQINELGGNIGKLAGWFLPQDHDWYKVAQAKVDPWVDFILPRLNRDAYLNPDGTQMADDKLRGVLTKIWRTIATDGADDSRPTGNQYASDLLDRGAHERVLHFKDGDAWSQYHEKFGARNMLDAMFHHIESNAKTVASLQIFGSHDKAQFQRLADYAYVKDNDANPAAGDKHRENLQRADMDFRVATGRMGVMGNPHIAKLFQQARTILAAAHLGTAPISALTDSANGAMVANAWNIGIDQWLKAEGHGLSSGDFRQFMRAQGVGVEMFTHAISRAGEEFNGQGVPGFLAQTVFRISGLNLIDNARRTAGGGMLMRAIANLVAKHETLAGAHPEDVRQLTATGTDERTWQVWRQADLDRFDTLSPDAIMRIPDDKLAHLGAPDQLRRDAAMHLIGVISRDIDTIVPMMTDKQRASFEYSTAGLRGKVFGELVRSAAQFKSFPIAMISNHLQRLSTMKGASKAVYAAELIATTTVLGAAAQQIKSLVAGNNPQDATDPKFWVRAFLQGGAGGLYADTILGQFTNPYAQTMMDMAGPLPGLANDLLFKVIPGTVDKVHNMYDPSKGKEGVGADVTRVIKGVTPGATIWWLKAAVDRLVFQRLQDYFRPGYAERSKQANQKMYGNGGQWWPTANAQMSLPQVLDSARKPDLTTALGSRQ